MMWWRPWSYSAVALPCLLWGDDSCRYHLVGRRLLRRLTATVCMRDLGWGVAGPREASGVAGLGFSTFGKVDDWGNTLLVADL